MTRARVPLKAEDAAQPGAWERVAEIVPVDATTSDIFDDFSVDWAIVPGTGGHEGALLVHRASGITLILSDLIGNLRRKDGFEGWMLHVMGFGDAVPVIPLAERQVAPPKGSQALNNSN